MIFKRYVPLRCSQIQTPHQSYPDTSSQSISVFSLVASQVRHLDLDKPSGWLPFPLRPLTVPDEEAPAPEGDTTRPTKQVDG